MTKGELHIVGTGIRPIQHLTPEAADAIRRSQYLMYLIPDPTAVAFISSLASGEIEDAGSFYQPNASLSSAYDAMIQRAMDSVRDGQRTCFALYGHPGVIVYPSHRLLRVARSAGVEAVMLPGVSAEDCLFCDLGIDPASQGCQTFWATDLLLNRRMVDPTMATILWSIGVVGCSSFSSAGMSSEALLALLDRLYLVYPPSHMAVVYEAATEAGQPHRADAVPLAALPTVPLDGASTLFIPPVTPTIADWPQYAAFEFPSNAATELFQCNPPLTNSR